jgi:hypothetical protein
MAAAIGALKGFLHFFSNDWARQGGSPDRMVTILDVLESNRPAS